ncbi:MAG: SDR family NAD(P)-dependent oxidoreductase [Burkholderiaceae bacterium]|jgi:short-subunit dehydrogenase|nr:SDR family NAD(P)-dependent oxidoreductase [Burkholderiaceae bacterium]
MNNDTTPRHIAIVGATSGMAEHCARLWAAQQQPTRFTLIGRRPEALARIADDLRVRAPAATITVLEQRDARDPADIERIANQTHALAPVDVALIAHGLLPDQFTTQDDLVRCAEALTINGDSPVLYAAVFVRHMVARGAGTLAVIGSVASDRGRKSNYTYGAAKAMVDVYMQGLQHRLAVEKSPVRAILVKPGPTDTPMTAHLKAKGQRLAPVEQVAAGILRAIDHGQPVAYLPARWQLIMGVIRHIPRGVFNRIDI